MLSIKKINRKWNNIMKKLYFLFTLVILLNLPFSCVKDPDVKVEQIEVSESNSISATWINFNGYFTIKYALPQKCYICIGQNKDLSDGVQYPFQNTYYNNTTFLYNYTVSSLIANTTYYYKFIFKNGDYQYETDIKEIKTVNYQLSTITTKEATNITLTSAISGGNISDAGLGEVSQRGICWSVTPNPTLDNSFTMDGVGTGDYSSIMANLTTHTTYYVRAYAINNAGVTYGNQMIYHP